MTPSIWEFDVGVTTEDLLKEGVLVAQWRRVEVESASYNDASLTAVLMATAGGAYVTEILVRI